MLEKDRFLQIKEMARTVRKENERLFEAFSKEAPDDAIREKNEFLETIIASMDDEFSTGDKGHEERQIFRASVLIPDDDDFLETYSKDKNIRSLMRTYAVGIEDIMSKITELNIYTEYLNDEKESHFAEESNEEYSTAFADEEETEIPLDTMPNLSSKDAESLLSEIEHLSSVIDDLEKTDYGVVLEPEESADKEEEKTEVIEPVIPSKVENEELSYSSDMSIDDISNAVDGFVDDYNNIQNDLEKSKKDLKKAKHENEKLKDQVKKLKEDAYTLKKNNLESAKSLKEVNDHIKQLENENITLKDQVKDMEGKIKRSSALLKKIYNSIPKKTNENH